MKAFMVCMLLSAVALAATITMQVLECMVLFVF